MHKKVQGKQNMFSHPEIHYKSVNMWIFCVSHSIMYRGAVTTLDRGKSRYIKWGREQERATVYFHVSSIVIDAFVYVSTSSIQFNFVF
jgi:hypothetical protein